MDLDPLLNSTEWKKLPLERFMQNAALVYSKSPQPQVALLFVSLPVKVMYFS